MNLYCIHHLKKDTFVATTKAPEDVYLIAKEKFNAKEIVFLEPNVTKNRIKSKLSAFFVGVGNWLRLFFKVKRNSYCIIQHPLESINVARFMLGGGYLKLKKIKLIAVVHDLDSLRKSLVETNDKKANKRSYVADNIILKKCDYVISHNDVMTKYLIEKGFNKDRVISLEIFDYLAQVNDKKLEKRNEIAIAGNLLKNKCEYLYKLKDSDKMRFNLQLFGPYFEEEKLQYKNYSYNGSVNPNELVNKITSPFGLVWDGTSIDECGGNAGEYLRYNNPHKTSLFLGSAIPVIVWSKSALSTFVKSNKCGIVVDSINDISDRIEKMSIEEYNELLANAKIVSKKITSGYYLTRAINQIIEKEQNDKKIN